MNFVTIASESWIDTHLRWFVETWQHHHSPVDHRLYVLLVTERESCAVPDWLSCATVKVMRVANPADMLWYDLQRLALCTVFGLESCLYADPDVDFLKNCGQIEPELDQTHSIYAAPDPGRPGDINNGMLYLTSAFDWQSAQERMMAWIAGAGCKGARNAGLRAFSALRHELRVGPLPDRATRMWWEAQDLIETALTIHYCNDKGKALRAERHPRRVTMLGMGPTAAHRLTDIGQHIIGEVWTLNDGYIPYANIRDRITRHYELHEWEYLKTWRPRNAPDGLDHFCEMAALPNATVYVTNCLPVLPRQAAYPWREVFARLKSRYFLGTPSLMLAHAIYEHETWRPIQEIRTYGFDHADGAHAQQRHAWAYWVRAAEERGIKFSGTATEFEDEADNDAGLVALHRAVGGLAL